MVTYVDWLDAEPLAARDFERLRRQAAFECCKWDQQVGDVTVLARYPLILPAATWDEIAGAAETLYRETLALEHALLLAPELHRDLALPWRIRRALAAAPAAGLVPGIARVMRFDFHPTTEGWRISEVNSDVPGGYIEAAGWTRLVAGHYPGLQSPADPAVALAAAIRRAVPAGGRVALIHATAYTDDRQVLTFLADHLAKHQLVPLLLSPADLRWRDGYAECVAEPASGPLAAIMRFYPAEWLPNLPDRTGWRNLFAAGRTPQCNPGAALLTQSKRLPLIWDRLPVDIPTWRRLLPETRSPRAVAREDGDDWVLKPAMGRVGELVGIPGVTPPQQWRRIHRWSRLWSRHWIAQRRFRSLALHTLDGSVYPCIGVFVIDGRAAGAYGRISRRPLIDEKAQEAAVLIADAQPVAALRRSKTDVPARAV